MKSFVLFLCVAAFGLLMVSGLVQISHGHDVLAAVLLTTALFLFLVTAAIDCFWPDASVLKPVRKTYTS